MTLRHIPVTFFPRTQQTNSRGESQWAPDRTSPQRVRMGLTADRTSRAEVRGNVEIEVYEVRLPFKLEGVGPGAVVLWDGSEWDIAAPPMLRPSRTHSVRHITVQIRRRPFTEGERD